MDELVSMACKRVWLLSTNPSHTTQHFPVNTDHFKNKNVWSYRNSYKAMHETAQLTWTGARGIRPVWRRNWRSRRPESSNRLYYTHCVHKYAIQANQSSCTCLWSCFIFTWNILHEENILPSRVHAPFQNSAPRIATANRHVYSFYYVITDISVTSAYNLPQNFHTHSFVRPYYSVLIKRKICLNWNTDTF